MPAIFGGASKIAGWINGRFDVSRIDQQRGIENLTVNLAVYLTLGVDYGLTVSCYQANAEGEACGVCDSCRLRAKGFTEAGVPDPTPYRTQH